MATQPLELQIELSGVVRGRSYICRIDKEEVELTRAELEALAVLAHARLSSATGLTFLTSILEENTNHKHQLIYRLRRAINEVFGNEIGHRLILSGPRTSFYLNVSPKDVVIHQAVGELAPHHLPEDLVRNLLDATTQNVSDV